MRGRAGYEHDHVGVVAVEQAGGDRGFAGVGDLIVDRARSGSGLGDRLPGAGHGDDRGAGLREGGGDAAAEAAARTHHDRGVVGERGHLCLLA